MREVTGEPLTAQYFVDYLRTKFTPLYGLILADDVAEYAQPVESEEFF